MLNAMLIIVKVNVIFNFIRLMQKQKTESRFSFFQPAFSKSTNFRTNPQSGHLILSLLRTTDMASNDFRFNKRRTGVATLVDNSRYFLLSIAYVCYIF